jgi:hypothetical protein
MRNRESITRRHDRICRVPIDLSTAASRQDSRVSDDLRRATLDARAYAEAHAATHDEVEHAGLFEHADALRVTHSSDEGTRDLGARLISVRVHDPILRVRGFAPQHQAPGGIEIEMRARCL